ncbi:MAG: carbohydrate ABC transporter permease [bacterium]
MDWRTKKRLKRNLYELTVSLILLGAGISFLMPFLWMLSTSLKIDSQIFKFPPIWIPRPFKWSNYREAIEYIPFFTYLKNTVIVCTMSVLGILISCPLVAYSFSRIEWPGRDFYFVLMLSTMMIPYPVTMIPLFLVFRNLGWINTFKPLIVPTFFGSPFFIFLLRQFFMTIPNELSDAAKIDGATEMDIYIRVILPLSKPALATVALFEFMNSWHAFLGPLIYLNDESKYTLALGLRQFQTDYTTEWALLMAASVIITVPVIVLFFFTQKTFIQGITLTGIKG